MPVVMPPTTKSFGAQTLVVLTSAPADFAAVTPTEASAGENVTCHIVGDWWPTATTEKVSRQRKMCQVKVTQALGVTTWETPVLSYTYMPQDVGTPGAAGNEAYEALPEGAEVFLLQRLGVSGKSDLVATDAYRLIPVELGPQVPSQSAEDAGGEMVISQEIAFSDGYDGPVDGVITV